MPTFLNIRCKPIWYLWLHKSQKLQESKKNKFQSFSRENAGIVVPLNHPLAVQWCIVFCLMHSAQLSIMLQHTISPVLCLLCDCLCALFSFSPCLISLSLSFRHEVMFYLAKVLYTTEQYLPRQPGKLIDIILQTGCSSADSSQR